MSEAEILTSEPTPPDGHEWVGKTEAAMRLGVSEKTIESMRNDRKLTFFIREKAKRGEPRVMFAMPIVKSKEQELSEHILRLSEEIGVLSEQKNELSEKASKLPILEEELRTVRQELSDSETRWQHLNREAENKNALIKRQRDDIAKVERLQSEALQLRTDIDYYRKEAEDLLVERDQARSHALILRSERDQARNYIEEIRKDFQDLRSEMRELRKPWIVKSIESVKKLIYRKKSVKSSD